MEDILSDPSSIPYTTAIHKALQPHFNILQELLDNPTTGDIQLVPAKAWLGTKDPCQILIPHSGSLSMSDQAGIANWFETHIALEKNH